MLAHLQGLLTPEEARAAVAELMGRKFEDGKLTARGVARKTKHNLQLASTDPAAKKWAGFIHEKLSVSEAFSHVAWPRRIQPFRFCLYEEGMLYGDHVDLPTMGDSAGDAMRTDLSVTLFLNPLSDYEGGHLTLHEEMGTKKIRGNPGDAVVYPSNMVHRVEPVTRGRRLVAISWVESRMRDERDRRFLFEMGRSLVALEKRLESDPSAAPELLRLRNCMYQLTRRWLD